MNSLQIWDPFLVRIALHLWVVCWISWWPTSFLWCPVLGCSCGLVTFVESWKFWFDDILWFWIPFSLDLVIKFDILLKSLLVDLQLMLSLIFVIWNLRSFMILLHFLTQLLRMDQCVLQSICFSWNESNCLRLSLIPLGTIFLLKHLKLKCKWHFYLVSLCSFPSQLLTCSI